MTEQLQDMKARLEAATPGPWEAHLSSNRKWMLLLANSGTADEYRVGRIADDDDAEFIAHAPEAQAKLIAALEAVEEVLKALDVIQKVNDKLGNVTAERIAEAVREAIHKALA